MELVLHLNRRHKTALFLTLLAAGTSLLMGADMKQAGGIVLLGVAFAWALGSSNRIVHAMFITIGLFLVVAPFVFDWYAQRERAAAYQQEVADFEERIPEMARSYPIVDPQNLAAAPTGLMLSRAELAHQIKIKFPAYKKLSDKAAVDAFLRKYPMWETILVDSDTGPSQTSPSWWNDAFSAGVNVAALPASQLPGTPPQAFRLDRSLDKHWAIQMPGLVLMMIGLGLLLEID